MTDSRYIHGTAPEEQQRLGFMNDLLNDQALRELALPPGAFVLDVGCGTAIFARRLAAEVGDEGRVLGVERDPEQIVEAERLAREENDDVRVEVRAGDALDLPLRDEEWGSFDVVHARFLLEHLPEPAAAVRQMVEAARPGGRIVLTDDDHEVFRVTPEPPGFAELWRAYMRQFDRLGNDPYIGRRLVTLLHEAGATGFRNTGLFFASCQGSSTFDSFSRNLRGVIDGARDAILSAGLLRESAFDRAMHALEEWSDLPDAAGWYVADWAEGQRPR